MFSSSLDSSLGIETLRLGASVTDDGVSYTVWAPDHAELAVRVMRCDGSRADLTMERREGGYFMAEDGAGRAGDRYGFVLPSGDVLPDPASRFQPDGVHRFSECIDPRAYSWRSHNWQRPAWAGQPVYELHVGAFTPAGTFRGAIERLEHIAALGVGAIEIMPVADFPGGRNWGYDGVALFAPARCYGRPDDLRALVDAAHERGLAVILDVVYNHLGPDGNHLSRFAKEYFDPDRHTPWGQAFNLSGPDSGPVRDYFLANAAYWLDEFRFDGLRLDATHALLDHSPRHLLAELADVAHRRGAFLIAEDDRNSCDLLRHDDGSGWGIDAAWADDFHHEVRVALTGVQESYFKSYSGAPADLAATLEHGWFYRGQPYRQWQGEPRGEPCTHLSPSAFVYCIENHDQVGNRAKGERLEHLISPSAFRAASALLCFVPYAPMLWMGQEWAASSPFLYFTDHEGELGQLVSEGRKKEFASAGLNQGIAAEDVPDPQSEETFVSSKLSWDELRLYPHASILELYRECLRLRAAALQPIVNDRRRWRVVRLERAIAIRYFGNGDTEERLVVSSLSGDTRISLLSEPLAPPDGCSWEMEFESNGALFADITTRRHAAPSARLGSGRRAVEALVCEAPTTAVLVARKGSLSS